MTYPSIFSQNIYFLPTRKRKTRKNIETKNHFQKLFIHPVHPQKDLLFLQTFLTSSTSLQRLLIRCCNIQFNIMLHYMTLFLRFRFFLCSFLYSKWMTRVRNRKRVEKKVWKEITTRWFYMFCGFELYKNWCRKIWKQTKVNDILIKMHESLVNR